MAIQQYVARGYGPRQMGHDLAILAKPGKQKNLGCGFIFWLIVFFPIAIIMAVNRGKVAQEATVTIRLDPSAATPSPTSSTPQSTMPEQLKMSDDGAYWWDGAKWVDANQATPPMAKKSPDGGLWWDGQKWRAIR